MRKPLKNGQQKQPPQDQNVSKFPTRLIQTSSQVVAAAAAAASPLRSGGPSSDPTPGGQRLQGLRRGAEALGGAVDQAAYSWISLGVGVFRFLGWCCFGFWGVFFPFFGARRACGWPPKGVNTHNKRWPSHALPSQGCALGVSKKIRAPLQVGILVVSFQHIPKKNPYLGVSF